MFEKIMQLISVVASRRKDVMLTMLLIFISTLGYIAFENRNDIISAVTGREKIISAEDFQVILQANESVLSASTRLMEETQADAVTIARFHNGKQDFVGIPFEYVSSEFEVTSGNFRERNGFVQIYPIGPDHNLTEINQTLVDLFPRTRPATCAVRDPQAAYNPVVRQRNVLLGFNYSVICPITNINDYPIGILSIKFINKPNANQEKIILEKAHKTSVRVGGYLESKLRIH